MVRVPLRRIFDLENKKGYALAQSSVFPKHILFETGFLFFSQNVIDFIEISSFIIKVALLCPHLHLNFKNQSWYFLIKLYDNNYQRNHNIVVIFPPQGRQISFVTFVIKKATRVSNGKIKGKKIFCQNIKSYLKG